MLRLHHLLLGLGLSALSAGAAVAATEGFRREVPCFGAPYVEIPSSWPRPSEPITYTLPCGYYGRVGVNEDAYYGPYPPAVFRSYEHRHRRKHSHAQK